MRRILLTFVAVLMAAVATVEAQKSGMGDSSRVERVDRVDGGGGDFGRKEHKEMEGGNEANVVSGITQFAEGEPNRW